MRKRCVKCNLLTHNWQRVCGGVWHCYDGCYSTTGIDNRSSDGSHWITIDYCTDYQVSQFGEIRSRKFDKIRTLKQKPVGRHRDYRAVELWNNGKSKQYYVHRLVLEAFSGGPPTSTHECNHKDGIKHNNHITNLEWTTSSENTRHAVQNKLHMSGEDCPWSKLTENDVETIKHMRQEGMTHKSIAEQFNVQSRQIGRILDGTRWKNHNA